MTDHATWMSFSAEQVSLLRATLEDARSLTEAEASQLLAVITQFTSASAKDNRFREAAGGLNFVRDGECETDDHAVTSASDEGAYVMAWVWVSNEEAGV